MRVVNQQGDLVLNAACTWWAIVGAGVEYSGDAGKQTYMTVAAAALRFTG